MDNSAEKAPIKKRGLRQAVAALKHRNYRLFWLGQCVSLIGTWMQNVAQAWLVLDITRSAFWLGVVSTIQFLPVLLFSLYAGTLSDRFPKKRVLILAQVVMMLLAFVLAVDILMKTVVLWHVLVIAALLGVANTLDMPTRQSFMVELVGRQDLMNAIVLNSAIFNAARVIGPSVGGLLIAKLGTGWCFFLNGASFLPVVAGLFMIRLKKQPSPQRPASGNKGGTWQDIKAGLSYVREAPGILVPLLLMAIMSIFVLNFNVLVPLYAKNVFHGGARSFGFLMSAIGTGAMVGSTILAARSSRGPNPRIQFLAASFLCVFELVLVFVKIYSLAYLLLGFVGISMITFTTTTNSLIQVQSPHHLRGRIMSMYTLVFAGFVPIGSFISGTVANILGAPVTLGLGAAVGLLFITLLLVRYRSLFRAAAAVET